MAKVPFEQRQARQRKIRAAMAFLQGAMAGQPRPAAEVEAEALAAGFSHTTIATARERLHISSHRRANQWIWTPAKARAKTKIHT